MTDSPLKFGDTTTYSGLGLTIPDAFDAQIKMDSNSGSVPRFAISSEYNMRISAKNDIFIVSDNDSATYTMSDGQINLFASKDDGYGITMKNNSTEGNVLSLSLDSDNIDDSNEFIGFKGKGEESFGSIKGHDSQLLSQSGVKFESYGADYAEYLPKADNREEMEPGDIIGVKDGHISKDLVGAQKVMVISSMPLVVGNWKGKDTELTYETVAFVGQVPVKIKGSVKSGDYIVPSGSNDGIAIAVSPSNLTVEQSSQIVGQAWESSSKTGLKYVNVAITPHSQPTSILDRLEKENKELKEEIRKIYELINANK